MSTWLANTRDRRLAAALGTLGVPISIRTTYLEKEGVRVTRFLLELQSADRKFQTKPLQNGWKTGTLQRRDPGHPLLTIMRGFENRERLLDFARQGKPCRLVRVPGTVDHQYVPSAEGLPGVGKAAAVIETGDLKMAAALGTAGLPLLAILPGTREGDVLFRIEATAEVDGKLIDGIALMRAWRHDKTTVPLWTPFSLAAYGLYNRERLLDSERKEIALVLLRQRGSTKSALIRADATDKAYDRAKKFFDE
jgi:hypothetical protein